MIRRANAVDIPKLVAFLVETGTRTKYHGRTEVDVPYTKRLLFGVKQRIMAICADLYATDLIYTVADKAGPKDAIALFNTFVEWAKSDPKVLQITEAKHDALPEGHVETLFKRQGFRQIGELYELDIDRTPVRSVA